MLKLNPAYLREYSKEHLWYEVWMFYRLGKFLEGGLLIEYDNHETLTVMQNLLLEGFVLHLRNLNEFFYGRPHKKHVVARMFYEPAQFPKDFPAKSEVMKKALDRAQAEMSHLTMERLRPDDPNKTWRELVPTLVTEMRSTVVKFRDSVPSDNLHPDFIEQTQRLLAG